MKYGMPRKLGRTTQHRFATLRNLAVSLFFHERIFTTEAKAKELRRFAEKIITHAKKNDLSAKRRVARDIKNRQVLKKIFEVLVLRYQNRHGGYTRIIKLPPRTSDSASRSLIELVS